MTRAVTDDARGSATEELRTRLEGLETTLRAMLAPSEDGGAPRAADVRALRGEITARKSEIRAREAWKGLSTVTVENITGCGLPSTTSPQTSLTGGTNQGPAYYQECVSLFGKKVFMKPVNE